jgi:hypothetical protein
LLLLKAGLNTHCLTALTASSSSPVMLFFTFVLHAPSLPTSVGKDRSLDLRVARELR